MVNVLTNKLFQFEMVKEGEYKASFLFWLARKYYDEHNKIFLKAS